MVHSTSLNVVREYGHKSIQKHIADMQTSGAFGFQYQSRCALIYLQKLIQDSGEAI